MTVAISTVKTWWGYCCRVAWWVFHSDHASRFCSRFYIGIELQSFCKLALAFGLPWSSMWRAYFYAMVLLCDLLVNQGISHCSLLSCRCYKWNKLGLAQFDLFYILPHQLIKVLFNIDSNFTHVSFLSRNDLCFTTSIRISFPCF